MMSINSVERAIPRLNLFINPMRRFNRFDRPQRAILQPNDDWRQVRTSGLPVSEPVPLENSTTRGRRTLLQLARGAITAETDLQLFDLGRPEPLRP
jgi:hypothetical protein